MSRYQANEQDTANNLLRKIDNTLNIGLLRQTPSTPTADALPSDASSEAISSALGTQSGGFSAVYHLQPDITAGAFVTGDVLSATPTKLSSVMRENAKTAILQSVSVMDIDGQAPPFDILLSPSDLVFGSAASNAAFSWGTVNTRFQGMVSIAAGDYTTLASRSIASKTGIGLVLDSTLYPAHRDLYLALVLTGNVTFTSNVPVNIALGFLLD